jgi:arginyl-tRNA synthetase
MIKQYLHKLLSEVTGQMFAKGEIAALPTLEISYPKSQFGDYATNIALILAKQLKQNPAIVADRLVQDITALDQNERKLFEISQVNGFINIKLTADALLQQLLIILEQKDRYGSGTADQDKLVLVEYFQNNVAKPPHIGHLRSAVIGDSLLRLFKFLGYKAISDTHVGDWGVQFGILLHAYKTEVAQNPQLESIIAANPIEELNKLYVAIQANPETVDQIKDLGKAEFKKLEDGDTENRQLWQWFVRVSLEDFERYRNLLGLLPFDHNLGESFYEDKMLAVLKFFEDKGLVTKGETGELYVDLEDQGLGRCILYKSDGATTYHMRDFATYIYRKEQFHFWKNVYVVDARQQHHFKQLFAVLAKAGFPTVDDSIHVDFGFMSLPEGPISTRKGTVISLQNLIGEAEKRALAIIEEKNPELSNKQAVSELVARAAIKYFDLSHHRQTDIVFAWDKALSFEGNTGPYLQYTHARISGILRKAGSVDQLTHTEASAISEYESSLLRMLIKFPEVLQEAAAGYTPHLICTYLFELSQTFNSFYQNVPVLPETDAAKRSLRLALCLGVAQVVRNGLSLLGIEAPEEM